MNPLKWLESKIFTGEVIQDFGPVLKKGTSFAGETVTLLLCKKKGKEVIVFRQSYRALLGGSVSYTIIPAEKANLIGDAMAQISARTKIDQKNATNA